MAAANQLWRRGAAFPLLKIDLDASTGPLSYLDYAARARVESVSRQFLQETRSPPLWKAFVTNAGSIPVCHRRAVSFIEGTQCLFLLALDQRGNYCHSQELPAVGKPWHGRVRVAARGGGHQRR